MNGYIEGQEFMNEEDIKSFLEFCGYGETPEDWKELDMAMKLQDLLSYWGSENIFGTDYYPMTEDEVKERWLNFEL